MSACRVKLYPLRQDIEYVSVGNIGYLIAWDNARLVTTSLKKKKTKNPFIFISPK